MRTLITTLMASAVSLIAFSAVQAADAIDEVPAAPAAEYNEPAVKNWSGAYVGGTANWARGEYDATGRPWCCRLRRRPLWRLQHAERQYRLRCGS